MADLKQKLNQEMRKPKAPMNQIEEFDPKTLPKESGSATRYKTPTLTDDDIANGFESGEFEPIESPQPMTLTDDDISAGFASGEFEPIDSSTEIPEGMRAKSRPFSWKMAGKAAVNMIPYAAAAAGYAYPPLRAVDAASKGLLPLASRYVPKLVSSALAGTMGSKIKQFIGADEQEAQRLQERVNPNLMYPKVGDVEALKEGAGAAMDEFTYGPILGEGIGMLGKGYGVLKKKVGGPPPPPPPSNPDLPILNKMEAKYNVEMPPSVKVRDEGIKRSEKIAASYERPEGKKLKQQYHELDKVIESETGKITQDIEAVTHFKVGENVKSGMSNSIQKRVDPSGKIFENIDTVSNYTPITHISEREMKLYLNPIIKNTEVHRLRIVKPELTKLQRDIVTQISQSRTGADVRTLRQHLGDMAWDEKHAIDDATRSFYRDAWKATGNIENTLLERELKKQMGSVEGKKTFDAYLANNKEWKSIMDSLKDVKEFSKIRKYFGHPRDFQEYLKKIPSEDFAKKMLRMENSAGIKKMKEMFPDEMSAIAELQLAKMRDASFVNGAFDPRKFVENLRQMRQQYPESSQNLFGPKIHDYIDEISALTRNYKKDQMPLFSTEAGSLWNPYWIVTNPKKALAYMAAKQSLKAGKAISKKISALDGGDSVEKGATKARDAIREFYGVPNKKKVEFSKEDVETIKKHVTLEAPKKPNYPIKKESAIEDIERANREAFKEQSKTSAPGLLDEAQKKLKESPKKLSVGQFEGLIGKKPKKKPKKPKEKSKDQMEFKINKDE